MKKKKFFETRLTEYQAGSYAAKVLAEQQTNINMTIELLFVYVPKQSHWNFTTDNN